jgi:hypothetical protein
LSLAGVLELRGVSLSPVPIGGAFSPTSLVLSRVADGTGALGATSSVLLEERSPTGTLLRVVPLPTPSPLSYLPNAPLQPLANATLALMGTDVAQGALALSRDGRQLSLAGYTNLPPGSSPLGSLLFALPGAPLGPTAAAAVVSCRGVATVGRLTWQLGASGSPYGAAFTGALDASGGATMLCGDDAGGVAARLVGEGPANSSSSSSSSTRIFPMGGALRGLQWAPNGDLIGLSAGYGPVQAQGTTFFPTPNFTGVFATARGALGNASPSAVLVLPGGGGSSGSGSAFSGAWLVAAHGVGISSAWSWGNGSAPSVCSGALLAPPRDAGIVGMAWGEGGLYVATGEALWVCSSSSFLAPSPSTPCSAGLD